MTFTSSYVKIVHLQQWAKESPQLHKYISIINTLHPSPLVIYQHFSTTLAWHNNNSKTIKSKQNASESNAGPEVYNCTDDSTLFPSRFKFIVFDFLWLRNLTYKGEYYFRFIGRQRRWACVLLLCWQPDLVCRMCDLTKSLFLKDVAPLQADRHSPDQKKKKLLKIRRSIKERKRGKRETKKIERKRKKMAMKE